MPKREKPREFVQIVRDAPDEAAIGAWLHSRLDDETIANWNERYYGVTIGHINEPLRGRMFRAHPCARTLPETTPLAEMFDLDDAECFPKSD